MLLEGKRIFVVEDNLENRIVVEVLLRENGADVGFERWGRRTIERLQEFAPVDLILLDLMFPKGVTGYDIFDEIRAEPAFAEVPIVAVSASNAAEAIPKTKEKGFAGFICKPILFGKFAQQIKRLIDGEEIWQDGIWSSV